MTGFRPDILGSTAQRERGCRGCGSKIALKQFGPAFKVDQLVVVVNMARLLLLLVAGALGWSPRLAPSRRIFLERLRYPVAALATTGPLRALAVDPNVTSLQARRRTMRAET